MAKIVKSQRDIVDVDKEIAKVTKSKKVEKKVNTKKSTKNGTKKVVKNKKQSFFGSVRKEMKKVVWPTKKEMVKYSIATITFVIFFALFFYLIEIIMALLKAGV